MKILIAFFISAFASAALAQGTDKPEEKPTAEKTEKPKPAPVVEIKRTGPPPCNVKPVMTDEEIETCKKAGRAPRPKPSAPELSR